MSWFGAAKNHWRITLLVVLLAMSVFLLFAPLEGLQANDPGDDEVGVDGITNLRWGLELSGGTSVRAPLVGYVAEDLDIQPGDESELASAVAEGLDVDQAEVNVRVGDREGAGSVETTAGNVTRQEFFEALVDAGLDVADDDVRSGVHSQTRQETVTVLNNKVNEAGLGGARVTVETTPTGERFVRVDVPNINRSELLSIIGERGVVEVLAHFPAEDGYRNETVLRQGDFAQIDPAQPASAGEAPYVPVTVTSETAPQFSADMRAYGFADEGGTSCSWEAPGPRPDDPGRCLLTVVDGEVVYAAGVNSGLAQDFRTGEFEENPAFRMLTGDFAAAQTLSLNLRAGALPAELDIDAGTTFYREPSLATEFRLLSLIVGIFAGLAVAGMVYWRYRDVRVAAPMLVTASGEVVILLAAAVLIPIPLDLAHIAGFIAVLGTGVDDLVIIADEIMQRGEIRTDRVFESRFRKAFWVIGVAAATTILAMTPLVAMSLGDLSGFAIVTIIGVLIGVLITRPAYGNILRVLMLD